MKRTITAIAALVLALVLSPAAANAETDELHPDVEYALEAVPGGIAVSDTEVVWPALGMILEAESAMQRAVGSCATGTYCAYAQPGLNGTKLTFTICANVSTSALQTVGSIANGRTSGSVRARNSSGTTLATAGANGSANVGGGTTNLLCTL
ncbi:hypothetical protein [Microbacterium sp. Root553]|uniref:hypothetical protein n=1 Tax=Microbacterium sp. Root553 TaxID=1736556 RepID=UPI0006F46E9E|nr:hypothetical protein [Microbacterium sp. Root553]KQZ23095.1 hypothetical protein ASD43_00955 [Microbacterium sp. Root553]